jgi:D-alanyl-D-alanine dipeptidase
MNKAANLFFNILFFIINLSVGAVAMALPSGFVYLHDVDPGIIQEVKYFTDDNFIGRPVKGYQAPVCILTQQAAFALANAQRQLKSQALSLKVFDCYRPQAAVNDFMQWSEDVADQKMKASYYPRINKKDIFKLGYLSATSGHTRGSTVDLTIVRVAANQAAAELNMGTPFDFLDERSHVFAESIQGEARQNRILLREVMQQAGFVPYEKEWWHFTLGNEPFPTSYFDFAVK